MRNICEAQSLDTFLLPVQSTTGSDFAALLTKHLRDVSHDLHLRVVYSATEVPPLGPPTADPSFRSMLERDNCAVTLSLDGKHIIDVLPPRLFDGGA